MSNQKAPPHIQVPAIIGRAIKEHMGKPALVLLMVKYLTEDRWIEERLWMIPGWTQPDLWKQAYKWVHNDARLIYHTVDQIEALRFHSFKLV